MMQLLGIFPLIESPLAPRSILQSPPAHSSSRRRSKYSVTRRIKPGFRSLASADHCSSPVSESISHRRPNRKRGHGRFCIARRIAGTGGFRDKDARHHRPLPQQFRAGPSSKCGLRSIIQLFLTDEKQFAGLPSWKNLLLRTYGESCGIANIPGGCRGGMWELLPVDAPTGPPEFEVVG